ncbi:inscuteable protein [Danaus plexippus plexippus]|uniref:Inscuteable protein n=1 Tax=Danaus plexippus plexippus TaxID=278856 RepID=A0A212EPR3_DANPL|nr:inscuteable protein [Danaus plexippus plexippus]
MSNFQRTRSKVWWGDSPPNIGSPVAQPEWNQNNQRVEPEWEPQLPHWINQPEQRNNSADNLAQANNLPNQWPLRHGSPGSHKSQDSGFSDSDSSPPTSQYYSPSDENDKNKSNNSSDSNNNENVTIKQAAEYQNSHHNSKDEVDYSNVNVNTPTPKPRLRSSSVIQTPYDLQEYFEVHQDQEHMDLLKDKKFDEIQKNLNDDNQRKDKLNKSFDTALNSNLKRNAHNNSIKSMTQNNKENTPNSSAIENDAKDKNLNILSPSKKYPAKKITTGDSDCNQTIVKMATVKDLDTNKNKCDDSLEYIRLSHNNEIAVNNQPRVRTPITNVSYVPTEKISSSKPEYRRSMSNEENIAITTTPKFQRNRLNQSLNLEGQKLDRQILQIQEGYHSLGYIDEEELPNQPAVYPKEQVHKPTKALLGKNIMDSLHLKPSKKVGPKAKHRSAGKDKAKEAFRLFSNRKEKPGVVDKLAGGVLDGSRVPSLGLPRTSDQNSWVVVGHPQKEMLIPHYNERLVHTDSDINLKSKDVQNGKVDKNRLTPPPQFQDKQKIPYESNSKTDKVLTHDSKREKLKDDYTSFMDVQLDLGCTSTPKMLAPHEFMTDVLSSNKKPRRVNLLQNFNSGLVLNNRDEILYRERSIDQTNLERLCDRKPEPVQYWLCDLVGSCENECMTTLQSKPLGAEMKAMVSSNSATITGNIKKVQTHGQIIVHQYSDVLRQMETNNTSEEQICLLVANINEFVLAHSITLNTKPPGETPERWDKIKMSLQMYLQKLIDIGEDVKVELNESRPEWNLVQKHLDTLIDIFLETTKAVLVQQMKTLVSIIEEPPSDMILKSTLTSIGHLAMLTENTESSLHVKCTKIMKSITELPFVDCGVPRALLTAIIESKKSSIKALSLRALATVCVTGEAVKQFEEGGGIEILSDILSDSSNPEPQMREAITVLTQITAPWLRGHYDITQLHVYLDNIIKHITDILCRTECCQLLLLCTACLVNLVRELELEKKEDADSDIIEVINKYHTVEKLLDAVKRRGPNISVFLQEQTASLLASLSRVSRCILPLSRSPVASVALVCFARSGPLATRAAELRATHRLHCHTAEAISRLAVIPDVAHQIVQLEGIPHLIRLVRMQRTRPHVDENPDQTLIHTLKALRTLHKHYPEAFNDEKDVNEMIKPHLMESLMLFSAKQESYV